MLQITVPETDYYDEQNETFVAIKEQTLQLEHSLVSLSKWESKWHKPYLSKEEKSYEEIIDYIRCMTITQNVNPLVYYAMPPSLFSKITAYVEDTMTATWFTDRQTRSFSRDIITAEIIYYWMVSLQIPFKCETWHLNRLLTLIRVCNIKNSPGKKMKNRDVLASNYAVNAARRKGLRG